MTDAHTQIVRVAILRHGPTDWNAEKRLQGRADRPLSESGRAAVTLWRTPETVESWRLVSSPLRRATSTAELLTGRAPVIEPRLTEMDFGDWEGQRLADLRRSLGEEMRQNEARGLDFTPPGGESPRVVMARIQPWLKEIALAGNPCLVVAHKAIIRALYAQATGWDMKADAPVKLRNACLHTFAVDRGGMPQVIALNEPLTQLPATSGGRR